MEGKEEPVFASAAATVEKGRPSSGRVPIIPGVVMVAAGFVCFVYLSPKVPVVGAGTKGPPQAPAAAVFMRVVLTAGLALIQLGIFLA